MTTIKAIADIDARSAERLADAGVRTLEQLLESASSASDRIKLADHIHADSDAVLRWVHQADLQRIEGVGPALARLLCEAGVSTAPKLAYRSADALALELTELNATHHLVERTPSSRELHEMIVAAKRLPKLVRH